MTTHPEPLYINEPNDITIDALKTSATPPVYINSEAGLTATVYRSLLARATILAGALATLTADIAAFEADDVGKKIIIEGAGDNGAEHETTIASVTSSTVVVLTDAANEPVSGEPMLLAIEGQQAIALTYVAASSGDYLGVAPAARKVRHNSTVTIAASGLTASGQVFRRWTTIAKIRGRD